MREEDPLKLIRVTLYRTLLHGPTTKQYTELQKKGSIVVTEAVENSELLLNEVGFKFPEKKASREVMPAYRVKRNCCKSL